MDDTWSSQQETTTIRNYYNGALLYRKHLCQIGRDDIIKEELYQGTSKGAEGYAARLTFKKAKDKGMNIAIQWQDADSSAKAVIDHFLNAEIMICGGHAGRAHKKQLERLQKIKSFTVDLIRNYIKTLFPLLAMWSVIAQGINRDVVASPRRSLKRLEITFRIVKFVSVIEASSY